MNLTTHLTAGIRRGLLAGGFAGAALLVSGAMSTAHAAQGVNLASGFTDFTTWTLLGDATALNETPGNGFTYSNLILTTDGTGDQAGAGFAPTALTMDFNQAFSFDFNFFIPANLDLRGDGLTFTLAGTPAVGAGGSDLGYGGLGSDSVAFAIDTFDFGSPDPVSPSIQILAGGSVTPLASTETGLGDGIREREFQWYATVNYTPSGLDDQAGTLTGYIENLDFPVADPPTFTSFSVSAPVDFAALGMVGSDVYYGFTAGNGLATDGHWITSAVAVPEPGSWSMLLAGMGLVGCAARRRA